MFFIFPKVVKPETCDEIIKDCKKQGLKNALINNPKFIDDPQVRKTSVCFINDKDNKINEFIWQFIREANAKQFNYDLDHFQPIQFAEYKGSENYRAFYDWHQDYDGSSKSGEGRKLSLTLALSDPDTFEGGELQFYNGGKPMYKSKKDLELTENDMKAQGSLIIFDSRDWHRVTPVTKGVRYSVVCWSSGQAFK